MRLFVLFIFSVAITLLFAPALNARGSAYYARNPPGYRSNSPFYFSFSPHIQNSGEQRYRSASRVRTEVVSRRTYRQRYYDGRGRPYYNTETVITYKKTFRDGRYKLYRRVYAGYQ